MKKKLLGLVVFLSIPLIFSCSSKKTKLLELNDIVSEYKEDINTCYDALNIEGVSSKIDEIKLNSKEELVYDSKSKQFVVMRNNKITISSKDYVKSDSTYDYFKFVNSYNPNSKYSQYLLDEAEGLDNLVITTGLDVGNHKDIRNVTYTNHFNEGRNVIVRTFCDYLNIDAPYDSVNFYLSATNIVINEISSFYDFGASSYLKINCGSIYFDDVKSTTDFFEVEEEGSVEINASENSTIYGLINVKKGSGKYECPAKSGIELSTTSVASPEDFKNVIEDTNENPYYFVRLESDLDFVDDGEGVDTLFVNHSVCVDLNGFRLAIPNAKLNEETNIKEAIRVESTNDEDRSLYIINSQGVVDEHSGIYLTNSSIVVKGNSQNSSNLVLNSGLIKQTITEEVDESNIKQNIGGAVTVIGDVSDDQNNNLNGSFIMYGGKLECVNYSSIYDTYGCVALLGKGANFNMVYGEIESSEFCVFSQKISNYNFANSYVSITGGILNSSNSSCLYFPKASNVYVNTSVLSGLTALNINAGYYEINNSTLSSSATGESMAKNDIDSSVIFVSKLSNGDEGSLNVNVNNSTLTSKFGHIVNVTGDNTTTSEVIINLSEGTYNYYKDNGINVFNDTLVTVNVSGGTWNKRSE